MLPSQLATTLALVVVDDGPASARGCVGTGGWSSWWQCWVSLSSWGAVTIVCSRKMGLASSHHGQQGERWDGNLGPSVERRESALATIFHVAPKINFAQDSLIYYYSTRQRFFIKYRRHGCSYCSTHSIVRALGYFDPLKYFLKPKLYANQFLCGCYDKQRI